MNIKLLLKNKLFKGGIWYIVGNFMIKGLNFLTLPIFTRLLSVEDFGIYNTYIAYQAIFLGILSFGMSGCIKNAKIDFEYDYNGFISIILSLTLFLFMFFLIIFNCFDELFCSLLGFEKGICNLLFVYCLASTVIEILSAKWVIELSYKKYIFISFFNIFFNIILSIFLIETVFSSEKYLGRIIGESIPKILLGLLLLIFILIKEKRFYKFEYWKYALKIGIPLVPHIISKALLIQFDRIMINDMCGSYENGIYSCIHNFSSIINVVLISFDMIWVSWLYPKMSNKLYLLIKQKSKLYVMLFLYITMTFLLVVPEVIKIIVTKDYYVGIDLIYPFTLVVYINFIYLFFVNVEFYFKNTIYVSIATIFSAGVNILLNFFFITEFGYQGAAYATVLAYIVLAIAHLVVYLKVYKIKLFDLKFLIISILLLIIFCIILKFIQDYIIVRYMILIGITMLFLVVIRKCLEESEEK